VQHGAVVAIKHQLVVLCFTRNVLEPSQTTTLSGLFGLSGLFAIAKLASLNNIVWLIKLVYLV
jgi:hypothetical protein